MTIAEQQDQIIAEFNGHADWLAKYQYLLEAGKQLPTLPDTAKTDATALPGCQARVWLVIDAVDNHLQIAADSDSLLTKGILALLLRVFNAQAPQAVATAELYFIAAIGFDTHLSPVRHNGLMAMLAHIQTRARTLA